ncbi:hypothetical protein NLI96_g10045 [Meripilus lineatus]|uniref:Uncharacterized protein n=1 Tax=Meripilus lineatus TaxID=2056292 RepID=A0AAD5UUE1_9APHY|nr:hypothetical protein NLI96_g10045 [Physisporinus lineatus]
MSYSFLEGPVELAYELASIVQRSVNLQELTFKDNSLEELLDAGGKAVMDTLSNLKPHTKLKRFCAGEISNRGMDLLLIIETNSITDLEVSYFPPSLDEPQFSVSPIPMLRNFHSTITHLELTNFDLWEADTIQCPLVRTLKLDISGPPTLSTWILMHAFPNIETLIFVRDIPVGYVSFMMDSIRDDNTIHEAAYETLCHWKKNLRYVQSKPTELYILRLPCHVHELRMEYDMGNCSRHHILQVLEDCTPTVVELSVEDGTNRTGSYFLTSLIDKLSLCHTSHLRLEMNFVGDPSDIKEYLSHVVEAISRPSGLQYLWFDMESGTHEWITRRRQDGGAIQGIAQGWLGPMGAEHEALSVAKRLPRLMRIGFDIFKSETSRGFWDVIRSTEVVGSGDPVSLLRLDSLEDEGLTRQAKFWDTTKD